MNLNHFGVQLGGADMNPNLYQQQCVPMPSYEQQRTPFPQHEQQRTLFPQHEQQQSPFPQHEQQHLRHYDQQHALQDNEQRLRQYDRQHIPQCDQQYKPLYQQQLVPQYGQQYQPQHQQQLVSQYEQQYQPRYQQQPVPQNEQQYQPQYQRQLATQYKQSYQPQHQQLLATQYEQRYQPQYQQQRCRPEHHQRLFQYQQQHLPPQESPIIDRTNNDVVLPAVATTTASSSFTAKGNASMSVSTHSTPTEQQNILTAEQFVAWQNAYYMSDIFESQMTLKQPASQQELSDGSMMPRDAEQTTNPPMKFEYNPAAQVNALKRRLNSANDSDDVTDEERDENKLKRRKLMMPDRNDGTALGGSTSIRQQRAAPGRMQQNGENKEPERGEITSSDIKYTGPLGRGTATRLRMGQSYYTTRRISWAGPMENGTAQTSSPPMALVAPYRQIYAERSTPRNSPDQFSLLLPDTHVEALLYGDKESSEVELQHRRKDVRCADFELFADDNEICDEAQPIQRPPLQHIRQTSQLQQVGGDGEPIPAQPIKRGCGRPRTSESQKKTLKIRADQKPQLQEAGTIKVNVDKEDMPQLSQRTEETVNEGKDEDGASAQVSQDFSSQQEDSLIDIIMAEFAGEDDDQDLWLMQASKGPSEPHSRRPETLPLVTRDIGIRQMTGCRECQGFLHSPSRTAKCSNCIPRLNRFERPSAISTPMGRWFSHRF